MGVPGITGQEPWSATVPPIAWTPSRGAPGQTPTEAAPAAPSSAARGEVKQPAAGPFSEASGVRLHVDAETNRIIAQIVDKDNKVVRQIPPEDALRIAAMTRELLGLLFDQSV